MSLAVTEAIAGELVENLPVATPLYRTPRIYEWTRAQGVIDLANNHMIVPRGDEESGRFTMTRWQVELMEWLFEENDDGLLRYQTALIGMPRKNGKSLLGTAIAIFWLLYGTSGTQIYSAARNRKQAGIVFQEAKDQILADPDLSKILKVYQYHIENTQTGARYEAIAADGMSAQGLGPELVIADEIHAWGGTKARELWSALTQGSSDRAERLVIGISTAGDNFDSLLGTLYEDGVKICNGITPLNEKSERFGFCWWAAPDDADPMVESTLYQANPNLVEGLMSVDEIINERDTAIRQNSINDFKRYKLNQWVRTDGQQTFFRAQQWVDSNHPTQTRIPKGARIYLGFDGSFNGDTTGLCAIDAETGFMEILAGWENTGSDEWEVPRDEVNFHVHRIFAEYDVVRMGCDATRFLTDVQEWARTYPGRVENVPQSRDRMIPITQQLRIDLASGKLWHGEDARLRAHFLNAIETPWGTVKKESPNSSRKIDFLVCLIMANGLRNDDLDIHTFTEEYE